MNGLGISWLLIDWLNCPSKELLEIVDNTEVLLMLDGESVPSFKFNPDWLNGLTFIDVSLVVVLIDEFGIVSNELEEILNAP